MTTGARLRQAREARGLSIADVARATRVQPRILEAIERNEAQAIPPRPYGRGFVRAYAAHIGNDPEQTVRDFFAQFAPTLPPAAEEPASRRPPSLDALSGRWRGVAAIVFACAVASALVIVAAPAVLYDDAGPEAIGTGGHSAPAVQGTSGTAGTTGTAAAPAQEAAADPVLTVTLEATRAAWVTATVDDQRAIYRTMKAGERETLGAERAISIRVGDAGAVRWQINGRPAVPMGASGEVRSARVTPDNAATLK
jgi:cytoskeletal protein RodZ